MIGNGTDNADAILELQASLGRILALIDAAGQDSGSYRGIHKAMNIVKSREPKGIKGIVRHLDGDFRMIYDNMVGGVDLQREMEHAYAIASRLGASGSA